MASNKRVNVLVYSGPGSTVESVRHCLYSLRRLLSPNYAVIPVNGDAIIKEPWSSTCALLVFPGGADLPYCRTLNGAGNRKIMQYVHLGGAFLGLCAGGYYACKRCEFMVGDQKMEVVGDRELGFFPGTCRGLAFPGFVYHSENGARAAEIKVNKSAFAISGGNTPDSFWSYFNGGGVFVDAEKYRDRGVEILASYSEKVHVKSGAEAAAVVYCKVGEGNAILTSPHPEFAAANLNPQGKGPEFAKVVEVLEQDDNLRIDFLKACLLKLGLQVNQTEQSVPSLSRLHLSSLTPMETAELVASWAEIITKGDDNEEYIKGENDTFHLEKTSTWSMGALKSAIASVLPTSNGDTTDVDGANDSILDYDKVIKRLVTHEKELPSSKETPYFNHHAFFANLTHYIRTTNGTEGWFGKHLMYGEVVTSTSTMLEKNPDLLKHVDIGFTVTATTQVAGRGRGSNVWVSPPGSLMFSTVIKHSMQLTQTAPVIFIQYLAALAVIRGVQTYAPGYAKLPVRLKWPNDIYALDPKGDGKAYIKIGGILVNSSYAGSDYTLVTGIGLNVANAAPTTSLNALATEKGLEPFQQEKLLARILTCFESIYNKFCREGWSRDLEAEYYRSWLHTDQIVTLEAQDGVKARIKGITRDWGLLIAEELGWDDRDTGKIWQLQSDSNSFDFFKGLVKRKI
ncbi:class II aaRS and biotin synthetase [Tothia fuscella]|uniref:Class II aaRS and biotin synthetase n=1 Tax=Tothia fuscella TaxID=1048955 RepID=A0A9P4TZS6_9PEZI|nr:class II aaRS and biotin synthetase [Tothia fuscella]